MFRIVFAVSLAIVTLVFGLAAFPGFKSAFTTDTAGLSYTSAAGMTALPYVAAFFVGYAVYMAFRSGGR